MAAVPLLTTCFPHASMQSAILLLRSPIRFSLFDQEFFIPQTILDDSFSLSGLPLTPLFLRPRPPFSFPFHDFTRRFFSTSLFVDRPSVDGRFKYIANRLGPRILSPPRAVWTRILCEAIVYHRPNEHVPVSQFTLSSSRT